MRSWPPLNEEVEESCVCRDWDVLIPIECRSTDTARRNRRPEVRQTVTVGYVPHSTYRGMDLESSDSVRDHGGRYFGAGDSWDKPLVSNLSAVSVLSILDDHVC